MSTKGQFLPADVIDVEFDEPEEEKTDADKKVDALADALKDDPNSFINVSRQLLGGNSPMEFVARYPADKYDFGELLALMQEKYGPGDYRFMLYAKGKLRANKLFTVAAPKKDYGERQHFEQHNPSTDNMRVLADMMRQQTQMIAELVQGGNSRKEFFEELALMKTLFNSEPKGDALKDLESSLTVLERLGIQVGGEKEPGFGDLLEKMTPVIETALKNPTPQANPQPRQSAAMFNNMIIKQGLKHLLTAATRGANPAVYAEVIIDRFPPQKIAEFFSADNAIDKVYELEPKLKPHDEWVKLVIEHVKAIMGMESSVSEEYDDAVDGEVVTESEKTD